MPYTTRVNGNETEIVGYGYTANGTPEPEVGNDWYPVVIDSYVTAEYASLDAYLASEYGQILLASCGVSALVPLATATQRLAENGINITVILPPTLFNRTFGEENDMFLVNEDGKLVLFTDGDDPSFFKWEPVVQKYSVIGQQSVQAVITAWGTQSLGTWRYGFDKTVTVDGVEYTFAFQNGYYILTPAAGTYNG